MISVIIPTYNRVQSISRALDSISRQTISSEVQIIVVDDGSTDGTASLLRQAYPQVELIEQSNQGVSAARNAGLAIAKGEWIALLDSDDEWLPHKLETQLDSLTHCGLLVSHTEEIWVRNGVRINQKNKHQKKGGWIFQQCLPLCAMSPSSILMHHHVVQDVGLFDETLPACEDYDYWLRLTSRYEVDFVSDACIVKYGGHPDQLSRQYWGMDRFRVQALANILRQDLLHSDREAAEEMLRNKLQILLNGARKHGNIELMDACLRRQQALNARSAS